MKILVVGEQCKDHYLYTDKVKPNPEVEGGSAYRVSKVVTKDGMASNTEANLRALGVETIFALQAPGISRTRLLDLDANTLVRIDVDQPDVSYDNKNRRKKLKRAIREFGEDSSELKAIVIQDYGKGLVNRKVVELCLATGFPVYVDPHRSTPLDTYRGVTLIKPNYEEAVALTNSNNADETFEKLLQCATFAVVTNGYLGSTFKAIWERYPTYMPAYQVGVVDVCGAGDTFMAALVFKHLQTKSLQSAVAFATRAAALTVQHLGVYAPTLDEIENQTEE